MGFWDFLKGKPQKQQLELSLDEVPAFVEKNVAGKRKELDTIVAKKFSEIKFVLSQMRSSLDELKKQPIESQNVKLKKIVGTSRQQAIARLSSLIERLQPPVASEREAVKQYCVESNELLQREIKQGGKSIAYTGIYLKESIKRLGQNVQELNNHLAELNKTVGEFTGVFLEKPLQESLKAIREKSRVVASVEEEIEKAKNALAKEEKERKRLSSKIAELMDSASFKEIDSLQEKKSKLLKEKQDKKTELVSLIASIDKPLKRFSKAVESDRVVLPGSMRETLRQFQQNPLQLLKKDPKGESIKPLLLELKRAVEAGAVELKEREKSKRLSAIDELLAFNFFSNVFWALNEIDSQLQSIERQLKEKPVVKELSSLEANLREREKSVQEAGFSLETLKGKLEKEREELSSLRQRVEELLQEISSASVLLK